jgi:tetratricopeptide (TPR) repeat protein
MKKANKLINYKTLLIFFLAIIGFSANNLYGQRPDPSLELIKKAKDHLNLFHYDKAAALLKQAVQINPENWEPYYLMGKALYKQKKVSEAEKYLAKAHELNSNELDCQKALAAAYIYLAKEAQKNSNNAAMVDYLHKACKAYPAGTKFWLTLFEKWWQSGDYGKIRQESEFLYKENRRILEQGDDKNLQQALVIAAKSHYRNQDFPAAERLLKYASMIRHTNDELYSLRRELKSKSEQKARNLLDEAQAAKDAGDFDKALELLEQAEKTSNVSDVQEMVEKIQKEAEIRKFLTEADALRKAERHEEALEKLEEASMQHPEDERIANLMAVVSKTVEKIHLEQAEKNAKVIAEKKRKLDIAKKLRFFYKEGSNYEAQQQYDLALISLKKALEITPDNKNLQKKIANIKETAKQQKQRQSEYMAAKNDFESQIENENLQQAYESGNQIIENFPENKNEVAAQLAEICLKLGKLSEARKHCIIFEQSEELNINYNYIRGMVAYQEGDRTVALEYLKKVSDKDSSFRPDVSGTIWKIYLYRYQLGIYIFLLALLFPAIKFVKETLSKFKISAMLRKIEKIREKGDYEANLEFLEERFAKEDVPNPKQITIMLAEALLRTDNPKRAYELISNLLKRDNNPNARRIAGEACLILEDSSPVAMEHIQNLYKFDESRKDVVEFLARTYMRQQADHKIAQDFIMKFISLNPSDTEAVLYLADIFIKRQVYSQQSIKTLEKAIKLAPDEPNYYAALIQGYRKLDNNDEAEKALQTAREKFPQDPQFMQSTIDSQPTHPGMRPAAPPNAYPDYDNIGSSGGGFPDYENIGNEGMSPQPQQEPQAPPPPPAVPGANEPVKVCPHCQAANPVKDYYCLTCGKPL